MIRRPDKRYGVRGTCVSKAPSRNAPPPIPGAPRVGRLLVERNDLDAMIRRLEVALAAAVVCNLALKHQNAERDHEVAMLMRWSIIDPLSRQVETLTQLGHRPHGTSRNLSVSRLRERLAGNPKPRALHLSRSDLGNICLHLGSIATTASVCSAALEAQHAEFDVEVATTLRHPVLDILRAEIVRLRALGGGKSVDP